MTFPINLHITGDLHVHVLDAQPILDRIDALEGKMTQSFENVDDAFAAVEAAQQADAAAEASDRAAFDALAADIHAFLSNLPPAGGTLTAEQSARAQALVDALGASAASQTQEASDEAALQGEVPTA